jgi:hypothetical protein
VKEWADIVEVIATTDVRGAIAHEMRVPHAAELDDHTLDGSVVLRIAR